MASLAQPVRVLIVGGGYVGMYTALGLRKHLDRGEVQVTLVDPQSNMTYQPFLPEAAAGSLEARHVVVPLRKVLRGCTVLTGAVSGITHEQRTATVQPAEGQAYQVSYDVLVVCPGSVSRLLPIPGLADHGIGFKTIGEAIFVRNHVLSRLDLAASTTDEAQRRRALAFVFVGGGYSGVEAMAELEDMARYALRYVPDLQPSDMRWVLVEASSRIMPEVSARLSAYTVDRLTERGIDVRLNTRLESAVGGHIELSDGTRFDAETLVWTAGVKANPMLADTDLPRDDKGRLPCAANLTVKGVTGVFAAGDCAAVPDLSSDDPNATCSPSAQHAVRQAKVLAANVAASIRGGTLRDYRHAYAGSVASLGLYRGVAEIYGVKLRGPLAWFLHRTYHVSRMPTLNRKVRVITDWTAALLFRREVVALGQVESPRREFEQAAGQRSLPEVG
jgi:NADH dehydrogenase